MTWASVVPPTHTLIDVNHGIEIEPGARVGDFGLTIAPVSNDYQGAVTETVYNDRALYQSKYWFNVLSGGGQQELTSTTNANPGIDYRPATLGYSCTTSNGLHRSASNDSSIAAMQEYILNRAGDAKENHLMEQYRQLEDEATALAIKNDLLAQLGNDPDIVHRVAYFEVAGRLAELTGALPDSADVQQLMSISSSGTSFAPVACATLHYYFPDYTCENQPKSGRPIVTPQAPSALARPAATTSKLAGQLLEVPNPAHESVRFNFISAARGATAPTASVQLVSVSSGRVLLEQPLPLSGTLDLNVVSIPAGVYMARVAGNGQLGATCKIVVVH
jgi:hypothetical protein